MNKAVLNNIDNSLLELSSKELQINYWLVGDGNKISSYIELMNGLFDDSAFDLFVDTEVVELGCSADFITEIRKLRNDLNSYDENGKSYREIIEDKEWQELSKQAQKVIDLW